MPSSNALEPAISISLWINAAKAGTVSLSDAANACETITNQLEIDSEGTPKNWFDFISEVSLTVQPVIAVLPRIGNLGGIPADLFAKILPNLGVVGLSVSTLLVPLESKAWSILKVSHKVVFPDAISARERMSKTLVEAEKVLSGLELVGSRDAIDAQIQELMISHVPPIERKRDTQDLHSAVRMRLVVNFARTNSSAIASPSGDVHRLGMLNQVEAAVTDLILAIASKKPI